MKDLAFLFVTMAVTAAWCAMWFLVISNDIEFPVLLHEAMLTVLLANGYTLYQGNQIAKTYASKGVPMCKPY
jgi:hypothetical protein